VFLQVSGLLLRTVVAATHSWSSALPGESVSTV
jgi:hypothetical protein